MGTLPLALFFTCRPDNGRTTSSGLDNRHVAPTIPYLLLKYQTHINVEFVASIAAIKYTYKYVYKGPDRAMAQLSAIPIPTDAESADAQSGAVQEVEGVDEIAEYQSARQALHAATTCWPLSK